MNDKILKELKDYLKERIEVLEKLKMEALEQMEKTYTEKGIYRETYFRYLDKKIEVEEVLLTIYKLEKEYINE